MAADPSAPISGITQEDSEPAIDGPAVERPKLERAPERVRERGEKVGRYVVLATLGRGGMGVVYSAWDPQLDRRIALKLVALAGEGDVELEGQRARLLREAQALARLEHPHVVQVHDVGVYEDQVFIAMEHVEGESLRDWLRSHRRSVPEIVEVFRAAAHGLAAAHAAGLVHRDFKPDNVLIGAGQVKVVDFGLAREAGHDGDRLRSRHWSQTEPKFAAALEVASAPEAPSGASESSSSSSQDVDSGGFESSASVSPPRSLLRSTTGMLTAAGTVLGTPAYMAPEQHRSEAVDARSDQYAFCIALWEAVYGKRPFSGREPKLLAERKRKFQLRESTRGIPVPRWLRATLMRGLAADPQARFADMGELIAAFDRGLATPRGMLPWFALLGLAFAIGLVATFVSREDRSGLCAPPVDRLAGVWDPARRLEIEQALLASDAVYANDTWTRVSEGLDTYREQWLAAMVSACEAVHVEGRKTPAWLEQRLACLDDRRRELVSLTALLARSDPRTLENAARATRSLSPIEGCEHEGTEEPMPMPGDRHERLRVEGQLDLLADAKAELVAGHLVEGLAAAREVLARAREIGWTPLEAEALLVIGDRVADLEQDPAKERATLHEAAQTALRGEHWVLAVEAWTRLSRGLSRRRELDEAKRWLDHAEALAGDLARATGADSPRLQTDLANARSQWHFHAGRYPEAEVEGRRRRDLAAQWYGPDSPQVADALNSIGVAVYMQFRKDEAVELYGEALAIIERVSGPEHPAVATMHNNIGVVLTDKGRWAEARVHYLRAAEIRRRVYPPGHELLMQSMINLANFYLLSDSPQGGLAINRELVFVFASMAGENEDRARETGASVEESDALRMEIVPYLLSLGRTLERSGAHESARAVLVEALDRIDRAPDSRLPPGPNLEGCRFDVASELRRSADALHDTARVELMDAILAASPMKPDYLQRCADEHLIWVTERRALGR